MRTADERRTKQRPERPGWDDEFDWPIPLPGGELVTITEESQANNRLHSIHRGTYVAFGLIFFQEPRLSCSERALNRLPMRRIRFGAAARCRLRRRFGPGAFKPQTHHGRQPSNG